MDTKIAARLNALREANANSSIEGITMSDADFSCLLERACKPVSDEDFVEREVALWREKWAA